MKKILLFFIFISLNCVAQNHAFKVNPIGFFNKGFEASYENYIENNCSIEIVVATAILNRYESNGQVNILGFEGKYKIYMQKKDAFKGIYAAPVGTLIRTSENLSRRYTILGIGAIAGYQFMLGKPNQKSGFIFDINIGASNYFSSASTNRNIENIKGFQPRYGASFGYAF